MICNISYKGSFFLMHFPHIYFLQILQMVIALLLLQYPLREQSELFEAVYLRFQRHFQFFFNQSWVIRRRKVFTEIIIIIR